MGAEELAPSSLKNRRIERQNKYFKEQVLMKEETKIIAKTHKGEAILTVDEENFNREEMIPSSKVNNRRRESQDVDNVNSSNNNVYNSDNELSVMSEDNNLNQNNLQRVNSTSSSVINHHKEKEKENLTTEKESKPLDKLRNEATPSNASNEAPPRRNTNGASTTSKKREIKFKNLTQEQINFYVLLEEYKKENLLAKFDNKLKNHLKISTYNEIVKYRQEN
jgi:hypothetical protein